MCVFMYNFSIEVTLLRKVRHLDLVENVNRYNIFQGSIYIPNEYK